MNDFFIPLLLRQQRIEDAMSLLNTGLESDHAVPYDLFLQNPYYMAIRNDPRLQKHVSYSRARLITIFSILEKSHRNGDLPQYLEKPLIDLRAQIEGL